MNKLKEQLYRLITHEAGQLYAVQTEDGLNYCSQKTKELTFKKVEKHILGECTIAVKPLQQKTQLTKFVCIDFDLENEQSLLQLHQFAVKVAEAFKQYGLPTYIEFSGRKGFHLWLFFTTPITGELSRKIAYGICKTIDFVPKEVYPSGDYMEDDGTGKGWRNIKLPYGKHRATNLRSGFLPADVSWDQDGYPVIAPDQVEIMAGFEQVLPEKVMEVLASLTDAEQSMNNGSAPDNKPNNDQHIQVDFSNLGDSQHPPCIQYLIQHGAPLDQEYNEANITLCRYAISREMTEEQAVTLATQMAQNTSSQHKTSKITVNMKAGNFKSAYHTVMENPADYQWSCGYILGSRELMSTDVCKRWNCSFWSYQRSPNSVNWRGSEADYAIERSILASVLYNIKVVDQAGLFEVPAVGFIGVEELGKDKIKVKLHQLIWEAILQLVATKKEISSTSILAAMGSKLKADCQTDALIYMDYLCMVDECRPDTFQDYLQRVKDTGLRITTQQEIFETGQALQNRDLAVSGIIDTTIDIAKSLQKRSAVDVQPVNCSLSKLVDSLFGNKASGIPTPSSQLNTTLNGGFKEGKLYVVGAPPASGKTTFCAWCADYAAEKGYPVLYVPYEMSTDELWVTSLARIGRIDSMLIDSRRWMDKTYSEAQTLHAKVMAAIKQYHAAIGDKLTIHEAGPEVAAAQLKGLIAKVRQRAGLADETPVLVVVDYLQLMPSGDSHLDSGTNETARVGRIATALKQLARDTNTAVIAISDVTKQAYQEALKSGTLDMSALRDSFKIAHAADVVMLLQTGTIMTDTGIKNQLEIVADQLGQDMSSSIRSEILSIQERYHLNPAIKATYARLSILKNRGGMCGEPLFVYEKAYHQFVPIEMNGDISPVGVVNENGMFV